MPIERDGQEGERSTDGRAHRDEGPAHGVFSARSGSARTESLAGEAGRRSGAARAVLAGHSEHGRAGAAGTVSAVDSGVLVDALEPALDDGDAVGRVFGAFHEGPGRKLSAFSLRGDGALGLLEQQRERECVLHHLQRGTDQEDLLAQAGFSLDAGIDRSRYICVVAGGDVRAACVRWGRG